MELNKIKFAKTENEEFYKVLRKRVNAYFKDNNISRFANANMVFKTIFMIALYTVPLLLILTVLESTPLIILMWVIMGFGMAGIGLSVMHDANHHAYSKTKWVNDLIGRIIYLVGGSDVNWRIQHNVLHHTYTNVTGVDEDVDPGEIMRFSPEQPLKKGHKYQYIYAWFLYGLMTFMWATSKDYKQYKRYKDRDLLKTQGISAPKLLITLILSKLGYFTVALVLPLIFSPMAWWGTVLCFLLMHYIAGLVLAMIFQPAHVVPTSTYPHLEEDGKINVDWATNQMLNTANFAPGARLFSWYVGGLNYQVEHHLFPNICHVHYRKISSIVRDTAFEYNIPYHSYKTFFDALSNHTKMLKRLGSEVDAPGLH